MILRSFRGVQGGSSALTETVRASSGDRDCCASQ
jgi:hypothetical protein